MVIESSSGADSPTITHKLVLLKNGTQESEIAVRVVMISLRGLLRGDLLEMSALYDLIMLCRNQDHKFCDDRIKQLLASRSLLQSNGRVHDTIRNVVLSAATVDGFDIRLSDPVQYVSK